MSGSGRLQSADAALSLSLFLTGPGESSTAPLDVTQYSGADRVSIEQQLTDSFLKLLFEQGAGLVFLKATGEQRSTYILPASQTPVTG